MQAKRKVYNSVVINKDFHEILKIVTKFRDERDWAQFHDPKNLAEALSIETSELLENFLWKDKKQVAKALGDKNYVKDISFELADIIMYTLLIAETIGVDLKQAVKQKNRINEKKYPVAKSKGNSTKYTKL